MCLDESIWGNLIFRPHLMNLRFIWAILLKKKKYLLPGDCSASFFRMSCFLTYVLGYQAHFLCFNLPSGAPPKYVILGPSLPLIGPEASGQTFWSVVYQHQMMMCIASDV